MSQEVKPITIKKFNSTLPLILNNKIIWKKDMLPFKGNVKVVKSLTYQEDLIYESKAGDFTCGDVRVLYVKNLLNKTTNSCRTIVKCRSQSGELFEKTSDDITRLIGQNNYDTLFSALCSVINQELKIRGIVSLLTVPKSIKTVSCQSEQLINNLNKQTTEMQCQTDESYIATMYKKPKVRRRAKRSQLAPYVIREPTEPEVKRRPRRFIITPTDFQKILQDKEKDESHTEETILPDLGAVFDNDSNDSIGKYSALSISTTPELLMNPMSILANVDKVTRNDTDIKKETDYKLHNLDSSTDVYRNPGLPLHQVLRSIPADQRVKALLQQGLNDWKNCLTHDENGHLPIHVAVLNNDLDLLKRQCLVLKMRDIPVDLPADNLTPLKMSLYQENVQMTSLLLQHHADPLDSDDHDRNCFHLAAEMPTEHLHVLVNHCQHNARKILEDNEELWKPEYANKSDKDLTKILMTHINNLYNSQGYTPLMLAAKVGRYENVKILVESCPESVNIKMPSSGNSALYLAVGAACMDSAERGNKSVVVDHFKETIDTLVENGADPNLNNFAGSNVNDLLTEYNNGALSMLIANKLTCRNFCDGKLPAGTKKSDAFMLIKDKDGNVDIKKLDKQHKKQKAPKSPKPPKSPRQPKSPKPKLTKVNKKTSVIQNVVIKSPKQSLIIKSETLTGQSAISPVIAGNDNNKSHIVKMPVVQNFRLDKPLILKTVATNNKRKLEITIEPSIKKSNTND